MYYLAFISLAPGADTEAGYSPFMPAGTPFRGTQPVGPALEPIDAVVIDTAPSHSRSF
jgi:hypothetical protein